MMKMHLRVLAGAIVAHAVLLSVVQTSSAGTIIKLSLGSTGADFEFSGGVLSTVDDTNAATTGDQNTAVDFIDFLSDIPDIPLNDASYTLSGVVPIGPAIQVGTGLSQSFTGGDFQLYDDSNTLLLDVDLGVSQFNTSVVGGTGSVFSVTDATIVGGSLQPRILDNSIEFSIAMTDITPTGGPLFTPVGPPISLIPPIFFGTLGDFTADGSKLIAGEIPEPATAALISLAGLCVPGLLRRRAS